MADYAILLESMDALVIQAAIIEDKLTAAPKDLKQISKYQNSRILSKGLQGSVLRGVPVEPLPLTLFHLGLAENTATTPVLLP